MITTEPSETADLYMIKSPIEVIHANALYTVDVCGAFSQDVDLADQMNSYKISVTLKNRQYPYNSFTTPWLIELLPGDAQIEGSGKCQSIELVTVESEILMDLYEGADIAFNFVPSYQATEGKVMTNMIISLTKLKVTA